MNCNELSELLAADTLPPPALEHLDACEACRAERASHDALARRLQTRGLDARADALAGSVVRQVAGRRPGTRRPWLRWALPAAAALALGVSVPFLTTGHAQAASFSALAAKVRAAGSVSFRLSAPVDGWGTRSATFTILDGRRQRAEYDDGQVVVADLDAGRAMVLLPEPRWAIIFELRGGIWNPGPALIALGDLPGTDLGTEALDGEPVRVLRTATPDSLGDGGEVTAWISLRSGLPRRLVMTSGSRTVTFSDFEFDGVVDPARFELVAPEGYESRPTLDDPTISRKQAMVNARSVFMGMLTFQQQHGAWPGGVREMVEQSILTPDQASNPRLPDLPLGYVVFAPSHEYDASEGLVFEPLSEWHDGGIVCFGDGHVDYVTDRAEYNRLYLEASRRAR